MEGKEAYCFEVTFPRSAVKLHECFDAAQKTPLSTAVNAPILSDSAWYSEYRNIERQQFPRNIRFSPDNHNAQLEIRNIEIKLGQFSLADLPVAKDFLEFDTCEDVQPGQLIKKVDPSYPLMARTALKQGDVVIYSVIGKDGTLQDLKAVESPHLILSEAAIAAAKQWRYVPPTCSSAPITVENVLTFRFHM